MLIPAVELMNMDNLSISLVFFDKLDVIKDRHQTLIKLKLSGEYIISSHRLNCTFLLTLPASFFLNSLVNWFPLADIIIKR